MDLENLTLKIINRKLNNSSLALLLLTARLCLLSPSHTPLTFHSHSTRPHRPIIFSPLISQNQGLTRNMSNNHRESIIQNRVSSIGHPVIYVPIRHLSSVFCHLSSAFCHLSSVFLQNKPNFLKYQINVNTYNKADYENISNWTLGENKPNQTQWTMFIMNKLSFHNQWY